jgi:hypothetical protein
MLSVPFGDQVEDKMVNYWKLFICNTDHSPVKGEILCRTCLHFSHLHYRILQYSVY